MNGLVGWQTEMHQHFDIRSLNPELYIVFDVSSCLMCVLLSISIQCCPSGLSEM